MQELNECYQLADPSAVARDRQKITKTRETLKNQIKYQENLKNLCKNYEQT